MTESVHIYLAMFQMKALQNKSEPNRGSLHKHITTESTDTIYLSMFEKWCQMMQLYGDVISERYKQQNPILAFTRWKWTLYKQKHGPIQSACASAASSLKFSIYRQNALRAEEGTKRQIVDTELFYNYGFHVSFLR